MLVSKFCRNASPTLTFLSNSVSGMAWNFLNVSLSRVAMLFITFEEFTGEVSLPAAMLPFDPAELGLDCDGVVPVCASRPLPAHRNIAASRLTFARFLILLFMDPPYRAS